MTKFKYTAEHPQTGEKITVETTRKNITFLVFRVYSDGSTGVNLSTADTSYKALKRGHLRGSVGIAVRVQE